MFNTGTGRFQPTVPGYYRCVFQLTMSGVPASEADAHLAKNGATAPFEGSSTDTGVQGGWFIRHATALIYLNGTTDYVTCVAYSPSTAVLIRGGSNNATQFEAELVASSIGVAPEPWHQIATTGEPAMQSGWTVYQACYYMKDPHGFVHLKGEIAPGTTATGTPIFTLPVGYRPTLRIYQPLSGGTGTAAVLGHFMVDVNGVVRVSDDGSALPSAAKWNLNQGFTWRGEQ